MLNINECDDQPIDWTKHLMTADIKDKAKQLGFLDCGFARVEKLTEKEEALKNYLAKSYHGKMKYMENNFEMRLNPGLLVDGAKTVISLLYNYYTSDNQQYKDAPVISKYAYGVDYHFVVKDKLNILLQYIKDKFGDINGRAFVDSAPILEKEWARKAGLGWIGKNSNLINKKHGSFFFISELIVDLELEYNTKPAKNYCANCTLCIDACPTTAIVKPGIINASRCISYLTIELRDEIPEEFVGKMQNRVFGCDICMEVCPFNKKNPKPHNEKHFKASEELLNLTKEEWQNLSHEEFLKLFKNSPVKRTKYKGIKRNLEFLKRKKDTKKDEEN